MLWESIAVASELLLFILNQRIINMMDSILITVTVNTLTTAAATTPWEDSPAVPVYLHVSFLGK